MSMYAGHVSYTSLPEWRKHRTIWEVIQHPRLYISKTAILWMEQYILEPGNWNPTWDTCVAKWFWMIHPPKLVIHSNDIGGISTSLQVDFADWGLRNSLCYSNMKLMNGLYAFQKMQMDAHWDKISHKKHQEFWTPITTLSLSMLLPTPPSWRDRHRPRSSSQRWDINFRNIY